MPPLFHHLFRSIQSDSPLICCCMVRHVHEDGMLRPIGLGHCRSIWRPCSNLETGVWVDRLYIHITQYHHCTIVIKYTSWSDKTDRVLKGLSDDDDDDARGRYKYETVAKWARIVDHAESDTIHSTYRHWKFLGVYTIRHQTLASIHRRASPSSSEWRHSIVSAATNPHQSCPPPGGALGGRNGRRIEARQL